MYWLRWLCLCFITHRLSLSAWIPTIHANDLLTEATEAVDAVLRRQTRTHCSLIIFTDGTCPSHSIHEFLQKLTNPWGVGLFEVPVEDMQKNQSTSYISRVFTDARKFRKLSWCLNVVALSDDPSFLASFAESSLRGRLLVWDTRLLVVTRLPLQELKFLLQEYWTFSMMNAMFMHQDVVTGWKLYVHLPYSPVGANIVHVATWKSKQGLALKASLKLFPQKFSNFHGALINVTGLPYPPYWDIIGEELLPDGTLREKYTGTDYRLLETVSQKLNFTFRVLPTESWAEVVYQVELRNSFIAGVFHVLMPQRMEHFDYTYAYEYSFFAFSLAKPRLRPKWQSLYYPLSTEVWVSILVTLAVTLAVMLWVRRHRPEITDRAAAGSIVMEVVGTLLGQNFYRWLPSAGLSRILVAVWLVFAFILGTAYRGNLTAALTLPKYPPRPETIEELVRAVDLVTMPPYGTAFRDFFRDSGTAVFQTLADCMEIGPSISEGLTRATKKNEAFMATRRNLEHAIGEQFTRVDGSTELYIGRENVFPGLSGWPVPHDAPYKKELDWIIMAVIEGGLYERWNDEESARTKKESRRREREKIEQRTEGEDLPEEEPEAGLRPLTLTHMQGPLIILLLGVATGGIAFLLEVLVDWCYKDL